MASPGSASRARRMERSRDVPLNWIETTAFGEPMDLALAIASACTDAGCQGMFLEGDVPVDAGYAEEMLAHEIRVEPGHLVAVDRGTTPPRVVYRWEDVLAMSGDDGYALTRDGRPVGADALRAEDRHRFLVSQGYAWARYDEPGAGTVRKYWKTI